MTNRIDAYLTARLDPYRSVQRPGASPAAREAAPSAPPARPATPPAAGLSAREQQAIDRYFPASEALALRVYGARGDAHAIQPGALGGRLDLTG